MNLKAYLSLLLVINVYQNVHIQNINFFVKLLDAHQISNLTHELHDPAYEALHREFKQLRLPDTDWRITIANKRFELVQ